MPTIVDDHHPHLKSDHECTVPTKKAARAVPTKKVAQVSVSTKKAAQLIPTKNSTQVNNNAAVPVRTCTYKFLAMSTVVTLYSTRGRSAR